MEEKIALLRKTLDEVIPRCSATEELGNALHARGIDFVRFVDDPNPSVIADDWERPISFSELGPDYAIEAIRTRIDAAWAEYEKEQEELRHIQSIDTLREIRETRRAIREESRIQRAIDRDFKD